jgi:DNA polymerase-3 subunit alpha
MCPWATPPKPIWKSSAWKGLKNAWATFARNTKPVWITSWALSKRWGSPPTFLIVWDFIRYARTQGIPVGPGRGSGAGALTAYALSITNIDPIQNGLLFERFLNPERRSMPDLDIDFSDDGREKVIAYVRSNTARRAWRKSLRSGPCWHAWWCGTWGGCWASLCTEVDRVTRLIPRELGTTLHSALGAVTELQQLYKSDPQIKRLLDLAQKLEGVKRHTGVHAAGTIIAAGELTQHVPLAKGSRDVVTTQYNDEALLETGPVESGLFGVAHVVGDPRRGDAGSSTARS